MRPMPTLTLLKGRRFDRELEFEKDNYFIGRDEGNDLVLEDGSISRVHAKIVHDPSGWSIHDLNSTNGVYINNAKVKEMPIKPGDVLVLGEYTFIVRSTTASDATAVAVGASEGAIKTLDALCVLARRFSGPLTLTEMLEALTDALLDVFRAERGFILLADAKGQLGDPTVIRRRGDLSLPEAKVQISKTVATRAMEERRSILITDVEADKDFRGVESIEQEQVRSIICSPIVGPMTGPTDKTSKGTSGAALLLGSVLGVVYLDSRLKMRTFTDADLEMLDRFVESAAHLIASNRERDRLKKTNQNLAALARDIHLSECDTDRLVGSAPKMRDMLSQLRDLAAEDVTVLITGESGTGKEMFARAIHYSSRRADRPFVAVNCMALSHELIESELFGHEKGAFSGAVNKKIGKFEQADGGTIFLDEIGEVSSEVQVKLLRVLQERRITPVGGTEEHELDIRLVTATNRDLRKAVNEGKFREDFYYRINVFQLELPPLRDRREDVPALVDHFIGVFNKRMGKQLAGVDPEAMGLLKGYDWPGNIRELRNVVERAFVVEKSRVITTKSLPYPIISAPPEPLPTSGIVPIEFPPNFDDAREVFEKHFIIQSLKRHRGNITVTSKETGLPRRTLYRRLEKYGIEPKELLSEEALSDMARGLDED
jgi:transcriptional regulator with GAF, ATPase, and Fis domain